MFFKEVELHNFRNYGHETVEFHPSLNIFLGRNAQGKSNLLESIYINSLGKSFRTVKDKEMIAFGAETASMKSISLRDGREQTIEIRFGQEGKEIRINGVKENKSSSLLEKAYIVIFSPDDLRIVQDEPEKRRKFLDRELCQLKPVYYRMLGKYKKLLVQRNTLLRKGEERRELYVPWDIALAECGSYIIRERRGFIKKLNVISGRLHEKITGGKEKLEILYEGSFGEDVTKSDLSKVFYEALEREFPAAVKKGGTGIGPHRDDFKVMINGVDARHFGSQGQQRTAALSLKLAETEIIEEESGEKPVLLLDDVLSELDEERQKFLLRSLSDVQLFITATELPPVLKADLKEGSLFYVDRGKVKTEEIKLTAL